MTSLYEEMKYSLHPRKKFRGWKEHARLESSLNSDSKDGTIAENQTRMTQFFNKK